MHESRSLASRDVAHVVNPRFQPGRAQEHRARRLIDADDVVATDPFVLMAEDFMPHGAFGHHPHRGIETVTLVLEGAVEHYDSAGNEGVLQAGDAQWMTAGRGVVHNESALPGSIAHTLQLWVNLPASRKMTKPRYQTLRGTTLPIRRETGVEVKVLSGRSGVAVSPTLNHVIVTALDMRIAPDAAFSEQLEAGVNAFILVLEGEARIGSSERSVRAGELAWLTRDDREERSVVAVAAGDRGCRALLFAGRPLREPVAFGGPFVMNTPSEIKQAYADFRSGRFSSERQVPIT